MFKLDPHIPLQLLLNRIIHTTQRRYHQRGPQEVWQPGKRLKLLFWGYTGARNTGADVRVGEMLRQLRYILGPKQVDFNVVTFNKRLSAGYYPGCRQQLMQPEGFPFFLRRVCPQYHGVVACEGSMFKSKFSDVLTLMMVGGLGMANAEEKLSLGYGAEAGPMTNTLQTFVTRHCHKSLIICRNQPSANLLTNLGLRTTLGTDPAWTFKPAPPEQGQALLKLKGWDGQTPILIICPINPFWWPVKPNFYKSLVQTVSNKYKAWHYRSVYFHHHSSQAETQFKHYITHLAQAVRVFSAENNIFPIVIGMEKLDRPACKTLAAAFSPSLPTFISDRYNKYQLASLLQQATYLLSSRYHAIVLSMAADVLSVGISMDERIPNLMQERGHPHLSLKATAPNLDQQLIETLNTLKQEQAQLLNQIGETYARQLQRMGHMGRQFVDEVCRIYPNYPRPDLAPTWQACLPPLSPHIQARLAKYG